MKSTGLSLTDIFGLEATLLINGGLAMPMLKILSNRTTHLTYLVSRLAQLNSLLKINQNKMKSIANGIIQKSIWVISFGYVLFCL
jgi:hypothetical protein